MRELEKRIEQWRREMRAKLSPEAVEELETHLRESMEEFRTSGRAEIESFELAAKRIGNADELNAEFEKRQTSWWAIKVATIAAVLVALIASVVAVMIALKGGVLNWVLAFHVLSVTAGYVGVFMVGAMGICFLVERLWRDFSPTGSAAAARSTTAFAAGALAFSALGTALGMIWAKMAWDRYWAWDPKETGAFGILTWLLLFIAISRTRAFSPRAIMTLAVLGNIVAIFGWFGANFWASGHWSTVSTTMILGGTALHLMIAALAFAPAGRLSTSSAR